MKFINLGIEGVKVIEQELYEESAGWRHCLYSAHEYEQIGIFDKFVQENHGYAYKDGCFRGVHCQEAPYTQSYLMQCINGAMLDYAIDLRKDSPTYKKTISVVLSDKNRKVLYIPKGCAHACLSLTKDCEFTMKVSSYYEPSAFRCIAYQSSELDLEVPDINLIISKQDKYAVKLEKCNLNLDNRQDTELPIATFYNDLRIINLALPNVKIIQPTYYEDYRGYFAESFSSRKLKDNGLEMSIEQDKSDFHSYKGTVCGIYCQNTPYAQRKIIRCTRGRIIIYIIDLQSDSPTFKKWVSVILSAENRKQIWIPDGFGYAYVTLCDNCEIQTKSNQYDDYAYQRTIRYDDPQINLNIEVDNVIVSKSDINAPFLCNSDVNLCMKDGI